MSSTSLANINCDDYTINHYDDIENHAKLNKISEFINTLQMTDQIAVESTSNSNWFYDICNHLVAKVVVVNACQFKVIATSCSKTDKNDAQTLAEFLSKDVLPRSNTKNAHLVQLRCLLDSRSLLVKQKTMLKNQIHGVFVQSGLQVIVENTPRNSNFYTI